MTFLLEILPADLDDADPALISTLGRDMTAFFREQGDTVEPVYTGKRGGEFLVQIGTFLTTTWVHKELILSDLSALMSTLTPLVLAVRHLQHIYEQRLGKDHAQQNPLVITIEVNGVAVKVEAANSQDVQTLAAELIRQLQMQPATGDTLAQSHTHMKIRAHAPKRPVRKRR